MKLKHHRVSHQDANSLTKCDQVVISATSFGEISTEDANFQLNIVCVARSSDRRGEHAQT